MSDSPVSTPKAPRRPPAPSDLGDAGKATWKAIWAEVSADLELDERERLILREACATADDLARLEELLGRTKERPDVVRLLSERRQQRLAYGRLLAQLDLGGASTIVKPTSRRAANAAKVRWDLERAKYGGRTRGQGA